MKWLFAVSVFSLLACAHHPLPPLAGDGLYPYGKYQHAVKIHVLKPDRVFNLRGIVSYTPTKLTVVGLSSFGTTVFRIEEGLPHGRIKKDFYLEVMQQHEDQFMQFYALIRELITAPKGASEMTRDGAHFHLSSLDDRGIFRKIQIEHPQFTLEIEVTNYEF